MSWRELILGIYETRGEQRGIVVKPEFYPAASVEEIADAEADLDARLPASLRSVLMESNGVMEMLQIDGGEWLDCTWLLWTVTEIIKLNRSCRAAQEDGPYTCDFRAMVFFANAGCDGVLFGFPVAEDRACGASVWVWRPIEDELEEVAPSLEDFLNGWLTGTIHA